MKTKKTGKTGNRGGFSRVNFFILCSIILAAGLFRGTVTAEGDTGATAAKAGNGTIDGSEVNASFDGLLKSADEIRSIYSTVVSNLLARIRQIQDQNDRSRERMAGLEELNNKLTTDIETIRRKEQHASQDSSATRAEYQSVKEALSGRIDALDGDLRRLEQELRDRDNSLKAMTNDLRKLTGENGLLRKDNAMKDKDLKKYGTAIAELKGRCSDLSNGLRRQTDRADRLMDEGKKTAEDLKKLEILAAGLINRNLALSNSLARERDLNAGLTARNRALTENLEGYRTALGDLKNRSSDFSNGLARQREESARLRGLNQASAEELARTRNEVGDLNGRNTELSDQLLQERNRSAEASRLNKRMSDELTANKADLDDLRSRMTEFSNLLVMEQNKSSEVAKKYDESKSTYDNLISELQQEIENGKVTVSRIKDKLTVNLIDKILFESGSIVINNEGLVVLRKIANVLAKINNRRIQIEGHTDNIPITSGLKEKFPTNWELASLRAVTVVRYLTENCGMNPEYISAAGYSEYKPVDANATPEGRHNNRRIEIILTPYDRIVEQLQ